MRTMVIDSMDMEKWFPNFEVRDEFTGLIHTLVAVEGNTEYVAFVSKNYADHLKQQKTAS